MSLGQDLLHSLENISTATKKNPLFVLTKQQQTHFSSAGNTFNELADLSLINTLD